METQYLKKKYVKFLILT